MLSYDRIQNTLFLPLNARGMMTGPPTVKPPWLYLVAGSFPPARAMVGKPGPRSDNQTVFLTIKWGELADCIYAQDDRELCDPDNRAAAVEATTKFFAYAKQTDGSAGKPAISPGDARLLEGFGDRLLIMLKNHRRYGTLVAADFGSFAPPEIMRIMREEKEPRDICTR